MKIAIAFFTPLLIATGLFAQSFEKTQELEIPFTENWDAGSFEFNGWQISEDSAWVINNEVGYPEPAAQLRAELLEGGQNYYCSLLTSNLISGVDFFVGEIFFDFNVKLLSIQPSNGERLYVDISYDNGLSWHNLKVFHGDDDYNFENGFRHINISRYAIGKTFQVRFKATGSDPERISAWFVDNIQIYRTCKASENLEGNDFWSNNTLGAEIKWEAPKVPDDDHVLVSWDKMEYAGGFGIDQGGTFSVAQRWDAGQLKNWNGMDFTGVPIKKIVFGLNDDGFDQMTLKIWSGPNASELLYERIILPFIGAYVEVLLDSSIFFDVDRELWVGYTLTNQPVNQFPAMYDVGPAVPGYGDLFTVDGLNWYNFSDYGYDNNLIIWTLFESSYTYVYQNGFNLYRMEEGVDVDYIYYDYIESVENQNQYIYQDLSPNLTVGNTYKYRLTTDWKSDTDSCESTFTMNPEETEDYVSVMITGMDKNSIDEIALYPNPAIDRLNISSSLTIDNIMVFNTIGQVVVEQKVHHLKNVSVNTAALRPGIYLVKIKTDEGFITRSVVIGQ